MASTLKHLRSSTANKRPAASGLADGQIAINTASGTPGMFFKDSNGTVVKVGPVHVGAAAPNAAPAGSAGNSTGELWINNATTIHGLNYYNGSSFHNLTPSGTETTAGLIELATPAETQAGTDGIRAVTPSGLQSKISDSISTTSSTTIASATAVKAAYDLANAALPRTGGRITGDLEIGPSGTISFEGSSDNGFETTLTAVNPTADRTITFPNTTGTLVTTGDTGTVTSTMIANGTIVDADVNASAAIALSKLGTGALPSGITIASNNIVDGAIVDADINASAAIGLSKLATGALPSGITIASANIVDGTIVNADINASAAIAGTKISPDFGSQNITTTGIGTAASFAASSAAGGLASTQADGFTFISGDQFNNVGANIVLYGGSHATLPSRFLFRQGATTRMQIAHSTGNVSINSSSDTGETLYVNGTIRAGGQLKLNGGDTPSAPGITWLNDENTGFFNQSADSIGVATGGNEVCRFNTAGTSGRRQIYFPATCEVWSSASLFLEGVNDVRSLAIATNTTANAANVFINSTAGVLQRSTSSIKYKTEVEDVEQAYSESLIYNSRPVWYRSLCENDPSDYSYWGFIAEEVAEIDPRMVHWGGEDGDEPEGVQYDRYVVHLVNVIQKQKEQLDAIEARLATLESQ